MAATRPPKYVQMSTVSIAEKYHGRANNAVHPVRAVPAAPRQLSAPSSWLAYTVTRVGRRTGNARGLRVTLLTTVSERP